MTIDQIKETTAFLQDKGITSPQIGVILGTGLGNKFVEQINIEVEISYDDIPHFPQATVEFHHGKLIYGEIAGKKVLAMQGRFHYYEGYNMKQVTFPVRVMKCLGVQQLLISNAAGNMNLVWKKGDMMLIEDHINLQPENPLVGPNIDELGPRFPDMSEPYDVNMSNMLMDIGYEKNINLHRGVYAAVTGPNLETKAEYKYLRKIGADVVGMSTVPEVIVANHMSLPCCAVSVLTDDCDPDNLQPVKIEEILEIAAEAELKLTILFVELISKL
ncbi:purine-nucleoside phosphorylase [Fulvivirga sediminis]|uniref:Purine nucleoside phosphorylase n=1 Tax=Fulvivirga sediminis TaxID=2803949 RepID=A0A937FC64_9BACT|nr:purine-nucleoside phosphorylase [Fulvivirga sediminis]MBL3657768.1 purine-nucleoside phosphorylase [Fulvivirga sediminis]